MSDDAALIESVRSAHQPREGATFDMAHQECHRQQACIRCRQPWPCDAIRLANALEASDVIAVEGPGYVPLRSPEKLGLVPVSPGIWAHPDTPALQCRQCGQVITYRELSTHGGCVPPELRSPDRQGAV